MKVDDQDKSKCIHTKKKKTLVGIDSTSSPVSGVHYWSPQYEGYAFVERNVK